MASIKNINDKDNKGNIGKLMKDYYEVNNSKKYFEGLYETYNKKIKNYLLDRNISKYDNGCHSVTLSKSTKESYQEIPLINKLKDLGYDNLIKTVETIDYDKLESMFYHGVLKRDDFSDMIDSKDSYSLRISLSKGAKK